MRVWKGNIVYVDRRVAELEGINVERLARFYAAKLGLKVVHEAPTEHEDGTATCHGCDEVKPRNVLYWDWYNAEGRVGLAGICRTCSGNEIKLGPPCRDKERLEAFEKMKPLSSGPRSSDRPAGQGKYTRSPLPLIGREKARRKGTSRGRLGYTK